MAVFSLEVPVMRDRKCDHSIDIGLIGKQSPQTKNISEGNQKQVLLGHDLHLTAHPYPCPSRTPGSTRPTSGPPFPQFRIETNGPLAAADYHA